MLFADAGDQGRRFALEEAPVFAGAAALFVHCEIKAKFVERDLASSSDFASKLEREPEGVIEDEGILPGQGLAGSERVQKEFQAWHAGWEGAGEALVLRGEVSRRRPARWRTPAAAISRSGGCSPTACRCWAAT